MSLNTVILTFKFVSTRLFRASYRTYIVYYFLSLIVSLPGLLINYDLIKTIDIVNVPKSIMSFVLIIFNVTATSILIPTADKWSYRKQYHAKWGNIRESGCECYDLVGNESKEKSDEWELSIDSLPGPPQDNN